MTAVLLVGGLGKRLRPVVDSKPKPLAQVGFQPFLELLLLQLQNQGFHRLVMCTGHLADQIETHFGDGEAFGLEIMYSREPEPLGTAGALKFAQQHLREVPRFLVMNGDSFLELEFSELIRFHIEMGGLVSMAVRGVEDARRYGRVQTDSDGRVTGFREKSGEDGPGLVNAGVYVFQQAVFEHIRAWPSSLETDILPRLLDEGVYALEQGGMFIDIGTPEDYARAQAISTRLRDAALKVRRLSRTDQV